MLVYVFVVVFLMGLILFGLVKWQELSFILSVLMLVMMSEVMFEGETTHISNTYFGVDSLSVYMLLLSNYVIILMYKSSLMAYEINVFMYELVVMGLFLSLLILFISLSMMMFYIMFEAVLIPTYLLILGWGYQPERMYAGNYLLFYTLFASLPLLGFLIYLDKQSYSLLFIYNFNNSFVSGLLLSLMGLSAFLVKVPMFLFHLWLPKAHVEAPVAGSMILAGVLLKMGGYGLMRMLLYVFDDQPVVNSMVLSVSLIGGVLVGLLCLRQIDLSSLVAYSSVVHMGLMLSGLFSSSYIGMCGSLLLMVGHGLGSSGLFYLSNVIYARVSSRSLIVNKGLMMFIPSVSMLLFMLISSNMAAPPSLNFIGEIELIASVMSWHTMTVGLLAAISFIGGAYCVYLFSSINHGVRSKFMMHMPEAKVMEYYVLILHWVPLNFLFMSGELFVLFL